MDKLRFHIVDYVVMALFLVISTIIGIYYGFFKQQSTTEEYLLGGRRMHLFPVALSLLVTYQSAISVLGVPVEVYLHNMMFLYLYFAICLGYLIQALLIVPLVYPLRLTSTYEYLGQRFQSRSVQLLGTVIGMLQTLLYMSIVLLAPALALEAVAGVPLWLSVIIIGAIGTNFLHPFFGKIKTFYRMHELYYFLQSINCLFKGGLRTVIWTDVFQFVVLYGGLMVILVMGGIKVGGFTKIFELAYEGERTAFNKMSGDPRVRHTVVGLLIGGIFQWLPNCCNQPAVQRICSMRSERDAKISTYLTIPLMLVYGVILTITGLLLYAYFVNEQCCPIESGKVGNANQLMPYFVMHVLNDVPGLGGIFIAALFSGALSSLSSGINSMSANTLQDILVNCLENVTQQRKTMIAKVIVLAYGVLAVILAYMARNLSGPVSQMALSAFGSAGGPVVGIFFLGAMFPQANWIYNTSHMTQTSAFMSTTVSTPTSDGHFPLYDMSYAYFGLFGFLLTMVIGLVVSFLSGRNKCQDIEAKYIFPYFRDFWKLENKEIPSSIPGSYTFEFKENGKQQDDGDLKAELEKLNTIEIEVKKEHSP
ncbi:sodium-dependent multivitamin transporter-like [Ruditapes philippinarum]|uniref:sodium-dependent multivitamin transporter-like n=1 Tax=Ruditapes philippinarum TaxID=129788 RepID=UPI00295B4C96|nr:sodium-dependent multivitamin transporter-like [Ruditapes philippinarum]